MSTEHFQSEAVDIATDTGSTAVPDSEDNGTPGEEEATPKTYTQEEMDKIAGKIRTNTERKIRREMAQPVDQRPSAPPQPAQFTTQEAYNDALVNHRAEEIANQREQQKQQLTVKELYEERADKAREKYSDFDAKFHNDLPISLVMAEAIVESDIGPDIAYYLGDNPEEASRISKLTSPARQAAEIGKIEAKLAATPATVKKVSSAPDPIKPLSSGSSSPSYNTSDPRSTKGTSPSDWIAQRNKELQNKKR